MPVIAVTHPHSLEHRAPTEGPRLRAGGVQRAATGTTETI